MIDDPTAQRPQAPDDWPEVIRVSIWLVQERDNWQALAADFDVVGQGRTDGLALQNLQELLGEYIVNCAEDGLSFHEVMRPIPLRERARLQFWRLLTPLHHFLHRLVSREGLIFPNPRDNHVVC